MQIVAAVARERAGNFSIEKLDLADPRADAPGDCDPPVPPRHHVERGVGGDASRGSGLGLVIARRVMEDQGGTITARCRPGGGASFVLYFRHPGKSSLPRHRCARPTRSPR